MSQAIDPYYYQSKLRDIQNQRAITTGRALPAEDTTAILNAELDARYRNDVISREQKRADEQLAIQKKQIAGKNAADTASGIGQAALGTAYLGKEVGLWGSSAAGTAAIPTTAATGGYGTGVGGQAGAAWGGSVGTAGTGGTAATPAISSGTSGAAAGGLGAFGWAAAIVGSAIAAVSHSEAAASGESWYGKTIAAGTPWKDVRANQIGKGGALNIATAPFFPEILTVGILKQQWDRLFG